MGPRDSTGNHASGNTHWRKRGFKKRRTKSSGSCHGQGELSASHSHFVIPHAQVLPLPQGSFCLKTQIPVESLHTQHRRRRGDLELLSELYLTAQIEFSFWVAS